jgi:hypothetical protein
MNNILKKVTARQPYRILIAIASNRVADLRYKKTTKKLDTDHENNLIADPDPYYLSTATSKVRYQ